MLGKEPVHCFFWDGNEFFERIIITDHAGTGGAYGHPFVVHLFFQLIIQIEAHAVEFAGGDGCPQEIPIKQFVLEFDGDIGHDQPDAGQVQFPVVMAAKELLSGLMEDGKDGIVANVAAVVEIGYTYGYFRRKREVFG